MKRFLKGLVPSVMAGLIVSVGCVMFLSIADSVVGAIFFTLGLFLVLTRGYDLYTGKIAYVPDQKPAYLLYMVKVWLGNLLGALLCAALVSGTKLTSLTERAHTIASGKLSQTPLSAFILAMFCGLAIYFAVENYKQNPHELGKYLGLLFMIPLFIICGFEHCVADMFYFAFGGLLFTEAKAWLYLAVITLGNSAASILLRLGRKYFM